jgi:hypothetical protein
MYLINPLVIIIVIWLTLIATYLVATLIGNAMDAWQHKRYLARLAREYDEAAKRG